MKKNTKKTIFFITAFAFLILVLISYTLFNKGPVNVAASQAIETNPQALYQLYMSDSIHARKTFDGKIVKLTGEVSAITENTQKQQVILIKTSITGGNINCTMDQTATGLTLGSKITVQGICSGIGQGDIEMGISGDVYLTRTIIAD